MDHQKSLKCEDVREQSSDIPEQREGNKKPVSLTPDSEGNTLMKNRWLERGKTRGKGKGNLTHFKTVMGKEGMSATPNPRNLGLGRGWVTKEQQGGRRRKK